MKDRERYLLQLALNLNSAMSTVDRYQRLLEIFVQAVPCDAACLLQLREDSLIPLSSHGLAPEVLFQRFPLQDHPRLQIITQAREPFIFPHDSGLPDPFDGLLHEDHSASLDVHSCLGCPLIVENEVMGVLTADALQPHQFAQIDLELLTMITALAGATLRTSLLIHQLEQHADDLKQLNQTLVKEANTARETPLLGVSRAMEEVRQTIDMVAGSDLSILITGETGTGKEVVARQIHQKSQRRSDPLIYVNCAALPESIVESELFGHRKGAFTGAHSDRMGKFELAHGGTLFLDEIGELPLSIQPKLLRALQEGEIQRVGSEQMIRVDVRLVAATNRNLTAEIDQGRFRADLYHRLNAYPLTIPPLRDRRDDILILASYFCDVLQKKLGTAPVRLEQTCQTLLTSYAWPGNVRELKNVLSRVILAAHHQRSEQKVLLLTPRDFVALQADWVPSKIESPQTSLPQPTPQPLKAATRDFQKQYILDTYERHGHNWSQTAKALGMHRSNLHHLIKRLKIID
jgi:anaerobic nitric oxide reductase transcription regulator